MNEKANNFIKNITEAGAIANKKGTIPATYTEGEQICYICSIDGKVVDAYSWRRKSNKWT